MSGDTPKRYRFRATIEPGDGGGAYVLFPYDAEQEFSAHGRVAISCTFDGVPYSGPLIKYGRPELILPVLKNIREQTGKSVGDQLDVVLWRDTTERVLEIPEDLVHVIDSEGLREFFDSLSPTHRREYCRWITEAKRADTRASRLKRAAQMLHDKIKAPG